MIPSQGSVGASGDLAPLAHLSAALLGIGQVRVRGAAMPAADGLQRAGLAPIKLRAKEGLALINGTQVSTALALGGTVRRRRPVCGRRRRRGHVGRCTEGQRLALRCAHSPGARTARPDCGGARVSRIDRRQRHPRLASGLHARPGSLFLPLPAAGDGRVPRSASAIAARRSTIEANAVTDNPLLFAEAARCCPAEIFTPSPWPSPPIRWRSRSPRSAACRSAALPCSWIRK